jgi:hypothetical protein
MWKIKRDGNSDLFHPYSQTVVFALISVSKLIIFDQTQVYRIFLVVKFELQAL